MLGNLCLKICLRYLNDINVFGKKIETAPENLRFVFCTLREAGLKVEPKKCLLFCEVAYLGHLVSKHGIQYDPLKFKLLRIDPGQKIRETLKVSLILSVITGG